MSKKDDHLLIKKGGGKGMPSNKITEGENPSAQLILNVKYAENRHMLKVFKDEKSRHEVLSQFFNRILNGLAAMCVDLEVDHLTLDFINTVEPGNKDMSKVQAQIKFDYVPLKKVEELKKRRGENAKE